MTIGSALLLLTVGAILKWAVTAHVSWINLQEAGLVLFLVGLVALVLAILYTFRWSRTAQPDALRTPHP